MKLLYITNGINGAGGLERVLSIKASFLAEHYGYDVTILTLNEVHPNSFYEFSAKIKLRSIAVGGNPLAYVGSYSKGIRIVVDEIRPNVISVCDDGLKGFFLPSFLSSKYPIIYERHASLHHSISHGLKGKIEMNLMRLLSFRFSKFVVLTTGNKKEWTWAKCEVIPNPLSFYPEKSSDLKAKKAIVVGTHSYIKGYDLLLESWKIVNAKHPDWELSIYGKIDNNKTFINLADQLSINNSVRFFPPTNDIQKAYLESSMLLLSSRTEGFGMVIIEAMACGVPCISFDCPSGPGDIIKNEVDGFLIAPENIAELATKIVFVIENEEIRMRMGRSAKENVKRFLSENIMEQWNILFKSVSK